MGRRTRVLHRAPHTATLAVIFTAMDIHTPPNVHTEFQGQAALYSQDIRQKWHRYTR